MPTSSVPDHYELLGVAPDADATTVKRAYRRLARVVHPDTGGTPGMFRLLTMAYETLSDPGRRREYDADLDGTDAVAETDDDAAWPADGDEDDDWSDEPFADEDEDGGEEEGEDPDQAGADETMHATVFDRTQLSWRERARPDASSLVTPTTGRFLQVLVRGSVQDSLIGQRLVLAPGDLAAEVAQHELTFSLGEDDSFEGEVRLHLGELVLGSPRLGFGIGHHIPYVGPRMILGPWVGCSRRCCGGRTVARAEPSSRLLVALYGPTSSGKTALSLDLVERVSRELGVEPVVVSADSRQVYRHMDIGTSKTMPHERRGVRHEMIDVAEPVRKFELDEYVRQARGHIEQCFQSDVLPLVVGGTAVYVKSLLEGWEVDAVGAARASLRKDFPRSMADDAYGMLRRLDRAAAGRVHPNNYEGVVNALARVTAGQGHDSRRQSDDTRTVVLGLDRPARQLDARVAETFDHQLASGLHDEVLDLADRYDLDAEMRMRGRHSENQVLRTHGYREFFEVASERGKRVDALSRADLGTVRDRVVATIQAHTRRQRSASAKMPGLVRVRTADDAFAGIADASTERR